MLTFAAEGSGQGKLEINGQSQPVAYEIVVAREEDDGQQVRIRVKAPRDWLMKQGFDGSAILIRNNGARIPVTREEGVDADDSVAVVLEGYDDSLNEEHEVNQEYPEVKH